MNNSGGPRESLNYRASVIDVIDIDGSGTALRLEPIRPSGIGFHHHGAPPLPRAANNHTAIGASTNDPLLPRPRRTQDEIRALLARTNSALDKIVKIRESMEPFVDFKQFANVPRTSSFARTTTVSRTSSNLDDSSRGPLAASYGSASSEDPIGDRSTGSTESTSSMEDTTSTSGGLDSGRGHSEATSSAIATPNDRHAASDSDSDDDDDDDTFSTDEDLPPCKEARLDRLKNITISFHEGLPTEFFMALARYLHSTVELKTRHAKFKVFKDTFIGSDAIRDMMLAGFADDHEMAVRYGSVLVRLGYIEHVSRTEDQLHDNKEQFYRFTKNIDLEGGESHTDPGRRMTVTDRRMSVTDRRMSVNANNYRESMLSRESSASIEYDFAEASDEVHALVTDETLAILARVLHKVFERKNKLLFYKGFVGCFLGAEAVNVIRELRIATSLVDAILIGQALLDDKIIESIAANVSSFQDRYVFYRLTRVQS